MSVPLFPAGMIKGPGGGRLKELKKTKIELPEFKIGTISIRGAELLFLIFILFIIVRQEIKRIRRRELEKIKENVPKLPP